MGLAAGGGSKRSEWVDEEVALGDDECVRERVAAVLEASERRLAVCEGEGSVNGAHECVVAAAEDVSGEGVSDGEGADSAASCAHSMRTR